MKDFEIRLKCEVGKRFGREDCEVIVMRERITFEGKSKGLLIIVVCSGALAPLKLSHYAGRNMGLAPIWVLVGGLQLFNKQPRRPFGAS